jgi:hypothetical protein
VTRTPFLAAGCLVVLAACSQEPAPVRGGRVVVALTVDWEGVDIARDGLRVVDELRARTQAPITHFVSAAYFTKAEPDPEASKLLAAAVHDEDELALHLHAWRSLAVAAGVTPRLSPSFITGTQEVADVDGDSGYETDLDVYSVEELRALVRTSKQLLQGSGRPVSRSFRAGGFLATPKMLTAIRSEGFDIDSSAIAPAQIASGEDGVLAKRLEPLWPNIHASSQPYLLAPSPAAVVEVPIAAFADYTPTATIVAAFDAAYTRLQAAPDRDVFVVLAFNLESAEAMVPRIRAALDTVQRQHASETMLFSTIRHVAERAVPVVLQAAP